jgi:hypothetical protein
LRRHGPIGLARLIRPDQSYRKRLRIIDEGGIAGIERHKGIKSVAPQQVRRANNG